MLDSKSLEVLHRLGLTDETVSLMDADVQKRIVTLSDVATLAGSVMRHLEAYGPSIVPHLMDTDDNAGEYLRRALRDLDA